MSVNRNYKPLVFIAVAMPVLLLGGAFAAQPLAQTTNQSAAFGTPLDPRLDPRIAPAHAAQMGIWKAVVPPVKMKGAFDDHDPIGLAAGKQIPADCSINWTNPDTHKLYCFSSATSLVYFLNAPHTNIARATKRWLSGS